MKQMKMISLTHVRFVYENKKQFWQYKLTSMTKPFSPKVNIVKEKHLRKIHCVLKQIRRATPVSRKFLAFKTR